MRRIPSFSYLFEGLCSILLCLLALGVLLSSAQPAFAQVSGPTETGEICMQKVFGTPVRGSTRLNCTANDIRLSRAISVSPDTCIDGETFNLTATFEVNVTANERYDAGFFFRIDGGADARGDGTDASGICSLSALDLPPAVPGVDLDGDTCGDLNSGTYEATFTIPGVVCQDSDGDGFLNLPNCTSWHSNQGTPCSIDPVFQEFDFAPDTKSKCVCDDDFQVPVEVETATITVVKSASPTSVPETGGTVTYTVQVTNDARFVSVTIDSIIDDLYPNVGTSSCLLMGTVLEPGQTTMCTFQEFVSGDTGETITDVVKVCGTQEGKDEPVCDDDDATVTITDVSSDPGLEKDALSAECTVDVTYQVVISNYSEIDTLTVDSLTDNQFGDITTVHAADESCTGSGVPGFCEEVVWTECDSGGTIEPTLNYTCEFVGRLVDHDSCTINHVDTVTGTVTDDDDVTSTPSDDAIVDITTTFQ